MLGKASFPVNHHFIPMLWMITTGVEFQEVSRDKLQGEMAAKRSNKAVVDKLSALFERLDAGLTPAQRKASLLKLEAVAKEVRARATTA